MMDGARLDALLATLRTKRMTVFGDFFLDKYLDLDPARTETSLETGQPAYQAITVRSYPGGAGVAASNLAALGVDTVRAVGCIGKDGQGFDLRRSLAAARVQTEDLLEVADWYTPTYVKLLLQEKTGPCELARFDIRTRSEMPAKAQAELMWRLRLRAGESDGCIIVDQVPERNHGAVTDTVRKELPYLAESSGRVFLTDSRQRIGEFRSVIVKPNWRELFRAMGRDPSRIPSGATIARVAMELGKRTGKPLFVTLSAQGCLLVEDGKTTHIPGYEVSGKVDPVGAGDVFAAGVLAALCAGATLSEAGLIGNLAASISVEQIGVTGTADQGQMRQRFVEWQRQQAGRTKRRQ
jgi:rfaE bifunctional protein kinase chain/domain